MENTLEIPYEKFNKTLDEMNRINAELGKSLLSIDKLGHISEVMKGNVSNIILKLENINAANEMMVVFNGKIENFSENISEITKLTINMSDLVKETGISEIKHSIDDVELSASKFSSTIEELSNHTDRLGIKSADVISDFNSFSEELKESIGKVDIVLNKHDLLLEEEKQLLESGKILYDELKNTINLNEVHQIMESSKLLIDSNLEKLNGFMNLFSETRGAISSYEEKLLKLVSETEPLKEKIESLKFLNDDKLKAATVTLENLSSVCIEISNVSQKIDNAAGDIKQKAKSIKLLKYPARFTGLMLVIIILQGGMLISSLRPDLLSNLGINFSVNKNNEILNAININTNEMTNIQTMIANLNKPVNDINYSIYNMKNEDLKNISDNLITVNSELTLLKDEKINNLTVSVSQLNEKIKSMAYELDELSRIIRKK